MSTAPTAERVPCDPDWHLARNKNCPACAAWDKNQVLLVDGRCMAKTLWVQAHAVDERDEERARSLAPRRGVSREGNASCR